MLTAEQMQRAIGIEAHAKKLKNQLDTYVLLKRDSVCKEVISLGHPEQFKKDSYWRVETPIPEEARRYVFRLWQRETTLKYNALVRELNQIGILHDLKLATVPGGAPC